MAGEFGSERIEWNRDSKAFIKLVEFVKNNSKKCIDARKKYELAGMILTYEKVWFTGDFNVDKFRVRGRDWEIEIALHTTYGISYPPTGDAPRPLPMATFEGKRRGLVGLSVSNRENMNRDLTLMRMFGVEELFSGS